MHSQTIRPPNYRISGLHPRRLRSAGLDALRCNRQEYPVMQKTNRDCDIPTASPLSDRSILSPAPYKLQESRAHPQIPTAQFFDQAGNAPASALHKTARAFSPREPNPNPTRPQNRPEQATALRHPRTSRPSPVRKGQREYRKTRSRHRNQTDGSAATSPLRPIPVSCTWSRTNRPLHDTRDTPEDSVRPDASTRSAAGLAPLRREHSTAWLSHLTSKLKTPLSLM